jgi:hypothetical protein
MGATRTSYVVYGYRLPYDLKDEDGKNVYWRDELLPFIEGHEGEKYLLVVDGMSGEYAVFGEVLAVFEEYGAEVFETIDTAKVDQADLYDTLMKNFGKYLTTIEPPKILAFDHFN